jgi:protease I
MKGVLIMSQSLHGKRIAILVADGFEQVEMTMPRQALDEAGAHTDLVSPAEFSVHGFHHLQMGDAFTVDVPLKQAHADQYDGLLLPGGVANPDTLRAEPDAVAFVRAFAAAGKPIAAICHGPWTLIEAGIALGRKMTSWPSIRTDLRNAGADWVDAEVVVDRGVITSRKPDDIPAFNRKMIEEFGQASHGPGIAQHASHAN